jgi:hypothetical protein
MSTDNDKSWPAIPPSQLKLNRGGPATESAAPAAPTPQGPADAPPGAPGPRRPPPKKASLTTRDWVIRGAMVGILLAALGVLVWSYQRLMPLQAQGRRLTERVNKLQEEVALMERGYTPADLEKLAREFQFAGAQLFGGEEALAAWFNGLRRRSVPLALEADADFGPPRTPATNYPVAVVPATLTLNIKPSEDATSPRSPHVRVLTLLDELVRQTNRADLLELHITAGSNSIAQVKAVFELWAGQEAKP